MTSWLYASLQRRASQDDGYPVCVPPVGDRTTTAGPNPSSEADVGPAFLSSWLEDPMLDVLAKRYTTILVGGAHVAVVPALEDRMQGGYRNVVRSVVDAAQPRRGEPIVEIGCGPGAVVRWLP